MSGSPPLLIVGFTDCPEYSKAVDAAVKAGVPHRVTELPTRSAFRRFLLRPDVVEVIGTHRTSPVVVRHHGSIDDFSGAKFLTFDDSDTLFWSGESLEAKETRVTTPKEITAKETTPLLGVKKQSQSPIQVQPSSTREKERQRDAQKIEKPPKKVIVVIGASGAQGGGLAKALLANGVFAVRGVSRTPDSEKAHALTALGVDMVKADLDDVESLKRAFNGAYGAYFVTNYWEHMDPETEIQQMKNLAHAARDTGLEHVVLSTLEDTRQIVKKGTMPTLHGDMYVPHFDGKGSVTDYVCKTVPTTPLYISFYYENFINLGVGPTEDGDLALTFPLDDVLFPSVAADDIGVVAAKVFEHPELIGVNVGVAGQSETMSQTAATFAKVLGKPVTYNSVAPEVYAKLPFPGAEDLANMFQFHRDYADLFNKTRDLELVNRIVPGGLKTFETWLRENKKAFGTGVAA